MAMRVPILLLLLASLARPQDSRPLDDPAALLPRGTSIFFEFDGLSRGAERLRHSELMTAFEEADRKTIGSMLATIVDAKVERAAVGVVPAVFGSTRWMVVAKTGAPAAFADLVALWTKKIRQDAKPATAEIASFTVVADSQGTIDQIASNRESGEKALPDREDFKRFRSRCPRGIARFHLEIGKLFPTIARVGVIKNDDIGAVLFASHLMHAAKTARTLSGSLDLAEHPALAVFAEIDPLPPIRAFTETRPSQSVLLPPDGGFARMSLARDLKQFWNDRTRLLSEAARAPLAEFQNNLGVLMGGLTVEDLFAGLGSAFDVYVTRGAGASKPGHQYPAAALVAVLADPALSSEFLLSFQTTIGIVNAQRTQERLPRFFQESALHREVLIACARLLPESLPDADDDRLQLEPSLATVQDRIIIGTNRSIVRALVDQVLDGRARPRAPGDELEISGPVAAAALLDAAAIVRSQMMLKEGRSEDAANTVLEKIASVLRKITRAHAGVTVEGGLATLDLRADADALLPKAAPESR